LDDSLFTTFNGFFLGKLYQGTADHHPEVPVTREQLNHYRNVAENVQSELAAALVRFECAQSEVRCCTHSPLRSASVKLFFFFLSETALETGMLKIGFQSADKVYTYSLVCLAPPTLCWLLEFRESV